MLWNAGGWIIITIDSSLEYMTTAVFVAGCIGLDSATLRQAQCREDESEILSQQLVLKKEADQPH